MSIAYVHNSLHIAMNPSELTEAELRFYRQLFLRRYGLLLEKAEHSFAISKDVMISLRRHILSLDWVDPAILRLRLSKHGIGL